MKIKPKDIQQANKHVRIWDIITKD